jgi:iron(III) transport system ATP-binding protein
MDIEIKGLKKYFSSEGKTVKALDDVNLTIPSQTIFTLLGPSGCGKSTLLRCIVGLETPTAGEIRIGGQTVFSSENNIYVPTEKRKLGMVFQTYAIWPHMNVFDNVAYPLQNQKMPKDEIRQRVAKTLKFVQLEGYEDRPATKLSGGQQQRVALARALVAEPGVILFDEPLSNLDAKLREETRKELKDYLTKLKITAIYVTHDRVEALSLSDTIAVMRSGHIIETGDPKKIYFNTENRFVADFIGRANLIPAKIEAQRDDETEVSTSIGRFVCKKCDFAEGSDATMCVRPELIHPEKAGNADAVSGFKDGVNVFYGTIESSVFVGDAYEAEIQCKDIQILARLDPEKDFQVGEVVAFAIKPRQLLLTAK